MAFLLVIDHTIIVAELATFLAALLTYSADECRAPCYIARMKSRIEKHRLSLDPAPSVAEVAQATRINRSTIYRIEAGEVTPSRTNARALFDYYDARISLAEIYDPEYAARERRLVARRQRA
ncbi:MAG: helix-turn-helix transcriptional regulator [Hyphomicrobiaceae bacterium]|nr:helix-turn-helix transcriptional regulator [Hyphomicrobiaceae bacterium]MCK5550397.1 helix-turn-helix transcriptional regulator [Hyphomicrobiaceae bacterium]